MDPGAVRPTTMADRPWGENGPMTERVHASRPPRATRHFLPDPVPAGDIDAMIEAARWTGSARNRQPWRFAVVTRPALRADLARLGAYAQHLAGAPLVIGVAVDESSGGDAHFDAGRAAQVLMDAAAGLGYGTCPATLFPVANAERAAGLVGLAPPWRLRWALSVGRPAPTPAAAGTRSAIPTGRLPLEEIVVRP